MYKVMIVDDEPIIVEGLSRSIAWEKWNCKVAATASSAPMKMQKSEMLKTIARSHFGPKFR